MILALGGLVGVPVAAAAYFFLKLVGEAQHWVFTTLPGEVGFTSTPNWWPILPLTVAGLLVGLSLRHLPGTGGHKPAEGFKASGAVDPKDLPGIAVAAFVTLSLGVVLGPEAPLIAIGSGLGVLAVHLLKRDAPRTATMVIGAAGSFAAISTLLGSPIVGAFLLMEASGLGGPMLAVVLLPGLLAAGIGSLIFVGLDNWTGYGTFSLAIPNIPAFTTPTLAEFLWAIPIGVAAAVLGTAIRRGALALQPVVEPRKVQLTPVVGFAIGVAAFVFAELTDHPASEVLFSGQDALPGLIEGAAGWTAGALVLLLICKAIGLRPRALELPRRPGVSGDVHRRRRRDRALAPARPADDRRRRDGDRRHDRRHAGPAADVGAARLDLPERRRPRPHAADHRRGGRRVRRLGAARARSGHTPGRGAGDAAGSGVGAPPESRARRAAYNRDDAHRR